MPTQNPTTLPAIGQPFEGGFFGGVVNVHGTPHAVVWAPKAQGGTKGKWHPAKPGLIAASCFDSMGNTQAMAAAGSPIATWALGLNINGHADWCIPARDVLELAYRHLKPTTYKTDGYFRDGDNPSSVPMGYPYATSNTPVQTTVEAFQKGNAEAFDDTWHWSSTQYSASSAWMQTFVSGYQDSSNHLIELRVRAVRLIQL